MKVKGVFMAIARKIKDYLDEKDVPFEPLEQDSVTKKEAFTASEIAGMWHIPGKQFAKCVVINADGKNVLCVLSACCNIDFGKLKELLHAKNLKLVSEDEMRKLFPDIPAGTEPPFGEFYGMPVYADNLLMENDEIVVNAGTHQDLLKLSVEDFEMLSHPTVGKFAVHL